MFSQSVEDGSPVLLLRHYPKILLSIRIYRRYNNLPFSIFDNLRYRSVSVSNLSVHVRLFFCFRSYFFSMRSLRCLLLHGNLPGRIHNSIKAYQKIRRISKKMIKKRMYRTTIHAGSTLREYQRWLAPSREPPLH